MAKPRIALLLSGQPRFLKEAYNGFKKNVLDNYDVDTFAFLWFDESKVGQFQSDKYARHNTWGQRKNTKWSGKEIETIEALFNPVDLVIQKEYDWTMLDNDYVGIDANHIYKGSSRADDVEIYSVREIASELFAMNKVIDQLKTYQQLNSFEYDWVIRMRPDFYVNKKIDFNILDNNQMYIPNIGRLPQRFGMHGLTNTFAMSNFYNMQIYMSSYEKFFDRVKNYGACVAGGEAWMLSWLYLNGFEDPQVWNPLLSSPEKRIEWQRRLPDAWPAKKRPIVINRNYLVCEPNGVGMKTGVGDCWVIRADEPYNYIGN